MTHCIHTPPKTVLSSLLFALLLIGGCSGSGSSSGGSSNPLASGTPGAEQTVGERLFLETYLDAPVELMLSGCMGRSVRRADVVEIGNLASCNATAMVALWARTANDLGNDAEIAVAVLTAPLSSSSSTQLISPVGCSTDRVLRLPSGMSAASAAGEPGIRQAVATLTALAYLAAAGVEGHRRAGCD